MEIKFEGALTKEEYLHLSKLASRPDPRRQGTTTIDGWLLLVVGGVALIGVGTWQILPFQNSPVLGLFLFLLGLVATVIGIRLRTVPHKVWEQNQALRARREGEITPEGLEIRTPNGHWRLPWTDFIGYGEYKDLVALFQGPQMPVAFPKHFFSSEDEWNTFRVLVAEKLEVSHRISPTKPSQVALFVIILVAILALVVKLTAGS